jgi:HTH-type transcriptional regulator/antitoxin HigA
MKAKVDALRPLHTAADHRAALAVIDSLWDDEGAEGQERLEVLAILVEDYERRHHDLPAPDPIDAIRFRLDQLGWSQGELGRLLRSKSRASELLQKRRPLSLRMIRTLHDKLKIPAEVLIAESRVKKTRPKRAGQRTSAR